jgi:hypothetical protein
MADEISKLLNAHPFELQAAQRKSVQWFEKKAAETVQHEDANEFDLMTKRVDPKYKKSDITIGRMYMFLYDAKTKDKLPYYDQFPLVLPFSPTGDGFIGLNLHYLPYDYRIKLLSKLMEFQSSKTLSESTRLNFSWQLISGVSRYKAAAPCVKRYLYSHVFSAFRLVPAPEWATAAMLPLERFTGSDKFRVWADSLAKI